MQNIFYYSILNLNALSHVPTATKVSFCCTFYCNFILRYVSLAPSLDYDPDYATDLHFLCFSIFLKYYVHMRPQTYAWIQWIQTTIRKKANVKKSDDFSFWKSLEVNWRETNSLDLATERDRVKVHLEWDEEHLGQLSWQFSP